MRTNVAPNVAHNQPSCYICSKPQHTVAHQSNRKHTMAPKKREPPMTGQEIFTAKAFCETYKVSRSQLTELLNRGEIEAKRLGKHIRISREQADSWFNNLPEYRPAA